MRTELLFLRRQPIEHDPVEHNSFLSKDCMQREMKMHRRQIANETKFRIEMVADFTTLPNDVAKSLEHKIFPS
jgi:hypothetical protein